MPRVMEQGGAVKPVNKDTNDVMTITSSAHLMSSLPFS